MCIFQKIFYPPSLFSKLFIRHFSFPFSDGYMIIISSFPNLLVVKKLSLPKKKKMIWTNGKYFFPRISMLKKNRRNNCIYGVK